MEGKDWKKAMEDTGFKYMDFVTSAKEGVARKGGEGWALGGGGKLKSSRKEDA
ncbi:hypothetical protein LCGC14_2391930 [marine sediment metagenome]|uniref:Uncharacterized protein n=1 Tax=marine sediment metagenome TaxID=412755 RepID=A0A0F9EAA3_9ZZZZ